jgi:transporter family-2 protein
MFPALSVFVGVLITLMITLNSHLAEASGNLLSVLVIHGTAFVIIQTLLFSVRPKKTGEAVPLYLRLGGILGVSIVMLNNICFLNQGASLTIALGILGQTLAAQIVDSTGFLGMEKHPFRKNKLPGWILIIIGAAVMTEGEGGNLPYIILSLAAGGIVMVQSVINAQLSRRIGLMRGTRYHFLSASVATLFLLLILPQQRGDLSALPSVAPLYLFGGGALGVLIVFGMNLVIPRIPAVYSAILFFLGQAGAGLIIDAYVFGVFSGGRAAGAGLMLLGLIAKTLADRRMIRAAA